MNPLDHKAPASGGSAPDTATIRAFLDAHHLTLAARAAEFAASTLAPLPPPLDDDDARTQAREFLTLLGNDHWLDPIAAQDLRALALTREALAAASTLADAVFALQALVATPLILAAGSSAAGSSAAGSSAAGSSAAGSSAAGSSAAGSSFAGSAPAGSATAELRDRWLPELLSGRAMGAFAMTEPAAGSDVAALTTRARRDGADYVLDGTKTFISNAGIADLYIVFASTDPAAGHRGISCFAVPAETPGFHFVRPLILSAPHPLGEIAFEGCRIPAANRLGDEGAGFKLGLATLDRLRPTVAAAACGMGARALHEALAHATTREQFGQPLAGFQLIQEKFARMATDLAAARLLTYRAVWEKDRGAERITAEAAMAKAYGTEAAQRIIDDAIQILGGRGVMAEHPVDHLYRAIRALRIYEGTTEMQHLTIAAELLKGWGAAAQQATSSRDTSPGQTPPAGPNSAPAPRAPEAH